MNARTKRTEQTGSLSARAAAVLVKMRAGLGVVVGCGGLFWVTGAGELLEGLGMDERLGLIELETAGAVERVSKAGGVS